MTGGTGQLTISLGGTAVVCCVHDRTKREITTERQLVELAAQTGHRITVNDRLFLCACCENLFVNPGDQPLYCHRCRMPNTHALGGPLAEPTGRI